MNIIRAIAAVDMDSVMNNGFSFPEKLINGGLMVLRGMLSVFAVIFIIWLCITIFRFFVYDLPNMRKKKAEAAKSEQKPEVSIPESTVNEPVAEAVPETDDGVTVAVITAALAAYMESTSDDGEALPFRVVSFKRKSSGKPWNSSL